MIQLLKPEDFHTQRNNRHDPMNTCGNTTLANLIEAAEVWSYRVAGEQLEDTIYRILRDPICQAYCLKRFPKYTEYPERVLGMLKFVAMHITGRAWVQDNIPSVLQVARMIQNGRAVAVLGHFYNGGLHYVTATGLEGDNILIADPFGDFTTGYESKAGYAIPVQYAVLNKYWTGDIMYLGD